VEQLEAGGDRDDGVEPVRAVVVGERVELGGVRAHGAPAPIAEQRAEALAAGEQAPGSVVDDVQIGGDPAQVRAALCEEGVEPGLHEVH